MNRFAPSEFNTLARQVAEYVRAGPVHWDYDAVVFDASRLQEAAEATATPTWTAAALAEQAKAFLAYWVASEPYAFDEAGLLWRRRHESLLNQIRTLRAWAGHYPAVQTRLARLGFEVDRLMTAEGDRRADAEHAAIERGEVIPCRAVIAA